MTINPFSYQTELELRARFNIGNTFTLDHTYSPEQVDEIRRIARSKDFQVQVSVTGQKKVLVCIKVDPHAEHPFAIALKGLITHCPPSATPQP